MEWMEWDWVLVLSFCHLVGKKKRKGDRGRNVLHRLESFSFFFVKFFISSCI